MMGLNSRQSPPQSPGLGLGWYFQQPVPTWKPSLRHLISINSGVVRSVHYGITKHAPKIQKILRAQQAWLSG